MSALAQAVRETDAGHALDEKAFIETTIKGRHMAIPNNGTVAGIDVIGDVHGYGDHLRALLEQMGYRETGGVFRHETRTAVFVGDLIDRGPQQVEVYRLVRAMCDTGTAQCVLGNHEFNAIGWVTTSDPETDKPLRSHKDSHFRQHKEFLEQVGAGSVLHEEIIAWFKTLPLWIDGDDIRVIHACWHEGSRQALNSAVDREGRFFEDSLVAALTRGTEAYDAAGILLKGPELALPDGLTFLDSEGTERREARIKWWDRDAKTYRAAAIANPEVAAQLPDVELADLSFTYDDAKPVFFGHYWLDGEPETRHSPTVCLDYSIAKGGALVAYRWSGEPHLRPENLVSVGALSRQHLRRADNST